MKNFLKSFKYAFSGIIHCVLCERNFRVHISVMIGVLLFACLYCTDGIQIAVLALTCFGVITMEAINTSVEATVDLVTREKSELAGIAKDVAAGAVLLMSIGSIVVACAVFSDFERLGWALVELFTFPNVIFTVLYIILSLVFVFGVSEKK